MTWSEGAGVPHQDSDRSEGAGKPKREYFYIHNIDQIVYIHNIVLILILGQAEVKDYVLTPNQGYNGGMRQQRLLQSK